MHARVATQRPPENAPGPDVVARELYDQQTDPLETANIAGHEDLKDLVTKLSTALRAGWKSAKP